MILKRIITALLVLLVVSSVAWAFIKEMKTDDSNPTGQAAPSSESQSTVEGDLLEFNVPISLASNNLKPDRIQVFYFHRTIRCTGCINVEEGTFEAVSIDHRAEVDNGTLEWRSIDFDLPENKLYAGLYDLYSQELILVEIKNGAIARSSKIADVWQHWTSKTEVRSLANELIDQWLGGIGQK
jgi:hypothetical protein